MLNLGYWISLRHTEMTTLPVTVQQPLSVRVLEWTGTVNGIAGAFLLAARIDISAYGWVLFAFSSFAMAIFAFRIRAWGLLLLNVCFCITNGLGLWRWLIEPAIGSGALQLPWAG